MASIISFSIFELFTFISFFFSIVSMVILLYILIRRRNIFSIAKKRSIKKSLIKNVQSDSKLNEVVLEKEREIKELKQSVLKYKEVESKFLQEISHFEKSTDMDYSSLFDKLKTHISQLKTIQETSINSSIIQKEYSSKLLMSNALKKKHPLLTDQEITLCFYFRKNTPSKEIAVIEGITDGTVRVYKNKIKNKIGLSQMDSLNEYLINIPTRRFA